MNSTIQFITITFDDKRFGLRINHVERIIRGIEVGANAYIVKSSFGQSNLLEINKRFV